MAGNNFERMMQIISDVFDTKNDPDQLDVDQQVIERLQTIHPATLSEQDDENGPVAWILIIPTTSQLMNQFVSKEISEQDLFELTEPGTDYDAIYLCSATVLPEYRKKGLAQQMTIDAINTISETHRIKTLFVWPFSQEGALLAEKIAGMLHLPLLKRQADQ